MTAQEQQLRAGHAEQMREVNLEKDKLTGSVDQLKVRMKRSDAEEGQDTKETKELQCVREWGNNYERFGGGEPRCLMFSEMAKDGLARQRDLKV